MTYLERVIVSAYTGYLMCDFQDVHKYIEDKLGRPIWTHEMAKKDTQGEIRKAVYPDFIALCGHKDGTEAEVRSIRETDNDHLWYKGRQYISLKRVGQMLTEGRTND